MDNQKIKVFLHTPLKPNGDFVNMDINRFINILTTNKQQFYRKDVLNDFLLDNMKISNSDKELIYAKLEDKRNEELEWLTENSENINKEYRDRLYSMLMNIYFTTTDLQTKKQFLTTLKVPSYLQQEIIKDFTI